MYCQDRPAPLPLMGLLLEDYMHKRLAAIIISPSTLSGRAGYREDKRRDSIYWTMVDAVCRLHSMPCQLSDLPDESHVDVPSHYLNAPHRRALLLLELAVYIIVTQEGRTSVSILTGGNCS